MLPPQLEHCLRQRSLSTASILTVRASASSTARSAVAHLQTRSLWGWGRPLDYSSHTDPMYHRFTRYRTLRTRAKLLDKLRRRGRWDWDASQHPFFTPKHVRLAHHIGRPMWKHYEDAKEHNTPKGAQEDSYELSQREKQWKDQMEAMRKRIEFDPYEAVFGKRFEPFWTPLVPSWMRQEIGLDRFPSAKSPKTNDRVSSPTFIKPLVREPEQKVESANSRSRPTSSQFRRDDVDGDSPNGQLTSYSYTPKKPTSETDPDCPEGQLTNYSYGSTTSWDSWTRKMKREEWDSRSGQTRRYEYDPITNRMVEVNSGNTAMALEGKSLAAANSDSLRCGSASERKDERAALTKSTTQEARQAIPVPTQTMETSPKKTSVYFPSLLNTSVVSSSRKPSSLTPIREKDLDLLTAEDVRSSMGKAKRNVDPTSHDIMSSEVQSPSARPETVNDHRAAVGDSSVPSTSPQSTLVPSLERMSSREAIAAVEPDDSAAHESTGDRIDYSPTNIPRTWNQQADLLQAERVQRTRGIVTEPRMIDIAEAKKSGEKTADGKLRWIDMMNARKARYHADQMAFKAAQEARSVEKNIKSEKVKAMLNAEFDAQKRLMQSHETQKVHKNQTLTKNGTAGEQIDFNGEMQANMDASLEQELARFQKEARNTRVVKDQNEAVKYQRKIQELRKELDASFKQSSVAAEKHMERIRDLEKELEQAQSDNKSKERYVQKTKSLRQELDRTFKQSAASAEKHVERIRELEKALALVQGSSHKTSTGPEALLAEGDFSASVAKFAKDSDKWYKRLSSTSVAMTNLDKDKEARHKKDRDLVDEVRAIYESEYGKIDVHHRQESEEQFKLSADTLKQPQQVVEIETDVDLGKALADYEAGQTYEYRRDNLVATQEKAAPEARSPSVREQLAAKQNGANALRLDQDVHGARIVDETVPRPILTETASSVDTRSNTETDPWGIQWEQPPVYKVLAYDAGNDFLSTATTSSNFTGRETPISIPDALSRLYQPARFVSHFAELQKQGYQVVHGTKDLLVFKKVKSVPEASASGLNAQTGLAEPSLAKPVPMETARIPSGPGVNPIDGTTFTFEPESASFASPTGFVGDRWETLASEGKVQSPSTVSKPEAIEESTTVLKSPHPSYSQPADEEGEIDVRHYPRVKREERVFSGSRLQRFKRQRRHNNETTAEEAKHMKQKWSSWRARVRWVLSVALGSSVMAYGIGTVAERSEQRQKRKAQQDVERWQQILEGRRARYE